MIITDNTEIMKLTEFGKKVFTIIVMVVVFFLIVLSFIRLISAN